MRGSTGGRIGKVVLIALAVETVIVVVTVLVNFLTRSAPTAWQVFLVPAAGVLIAGVKAGLDAIASDTDRSSTPDPPTVGYADHGGGMYGPRPVAVPRKRHVPVVAVLAVLLLVCGGGGLAVTAAVHYVYGWVTGNETGRVVFQGQASGKASALTVTVTQVMITRHFTRLDVTVQNAGSETVTLPLYRNSQLVGADGRTLEADSFRSQWSESVPPGVRQSGKINLTGRAPPGKSVLSFATVFGPGGGGALVIKDIPIETP
jgi:hypothetical protein